MSADIKALEERLMEGLEQCPEWGGNFGHGHVWKRPDGVRARCGGPAMCRECAKDLARSRAPDFSRDNIRVILGALRAAEAERDIERECKEHARKCCEAAEARLEELTRERDEALRMQNGYRWHLTECEQIAGKALGYPWYKDDQKNFPDATEKDGVCIGEHVGDTIVAELAARLEEAKAVLERHSCECDSYHGFTCARCEVLQSLGGSDAR